jgi:hypothetical protein
LAEVLLSTGRYYLSVGGFALAMEGDACRDGDFPDELYDAIPEEERLTATIRGSLWNKGMLTFVAERINERTR